MSNRIKFVVPGIDQQVNACGKIETEEENSFYSAECALFQQIKTPKKGDWLKSFAEQGQTFSEYTQNKMGRWRDTLHLIPIGKFEDNLQIGLIQQYCSAYLQIKVELLESIKLKKITEDLFAMKYNGNTESLASRQRTSDTNRKEKFTQLLTKDIFSFLMELKPANSVAILGITMYDLYPDKNWNFVFGEADVEDSCGVFSFARYQPEFNQFQNKYEKSLLYRICQVCVHEILHLFGLMHCIFFDCCMNGSNSIQESDSQSIHLCPCDLRKLQYFTKCDLLQRYEDLFNWYEENNFEIEKKWISDRIDFVNS